MAGTRKRSDARRGVQVSLATPGPTGPASHRHRPLVGRSTPCAHAPQRVAGGHPRLSPRDEGVQSRVAPGSAPHVPSVPGVSWPAPDRLRNPSSARPPPAPGPRPSSGGEDRTSSRDGRLMAHADPRDADPRWSGACESHGHAAHDDGGLMRLLPRAPLDRDDVDAAGHGDSRAQVGQTDGHGPRAGGGPCGTAQWPTPSEAGPPFRPPAPRLRRPSGVQEEVD